MAKEFFIRKEQGAKKYKGKRKREKSKAGKTERAGKRRTEGKKRKAEKKEKEKQKTTKSEMKKSRKLFAATLLTRGLIYKNKTRDFSGSCILTVRLFRLSGSHRFQPR